MASPGTSPATPAEPTVVLPSAPPVPLPAAPPPSGVELWVSSYSDSAWHRFLESTGAGLRGLCLSREFPDRLRAYLGPRDVDLIWISNAGRDRSVRPSDLEGIEAAVRRGLSEGRVGVVYLAGIEYLLSLHPIEAVLGLLQRVDAVAHETLARVIVPLNPTLAPAGKATRLQDAFPSEPPQ